MVGFPRLWVGDGRTKTITTGRLSNNRKRKKKNNNNNNNNINGPGWVVAYWSIYARSLSGLQVTMGLVGIGPVSFKKEIERETMRETTTESNRRRVSGEKAAEIGRSGGIVYMSVHVLSVRFWF